MGVIGGNSGRLRGGKLGEGAFNVCSELHHKEDPHHAQHVQ